MVNHAGGLRVAGEIVDHMLRGIRIDDIADDRIVAVAELAERHPVLAQTKGGDDPVAEKMALHGGEQRVGLLNRRAVGAAGGGVVGVGGRILTATERDLRGQRAVVADAVGVVVSLGDVVSHRHAVVRINRIGVEWAAGEHEPGVGARIVVPHARGEPDETVAAEPAPLRFERVGNRDARFLVVAVVEIAPPVAVEVEAAKEGIRRTAEAERAVGFAAQDRARVHHELHREIGALVVVAEVEKKFVRHAPVRRDGVIRERLCAHHAGTGGVVEIRIDARVADAQRAAGAAAGAVRRAHGGVVVGAGEVGADGVEKLAGVFDECHAMVEPAARAIAPGDAERDLRGGGQRGRRCNRDCIDAARGAVVIPRKHLLRFDAGAHHSGGVAAGLAHQRDREARTRAKQHRRKHALLVLEIEIAPAAVLLIHGGDGGGDHVFLQHRVVVELGAAATPRAEAVADVGAVAVGRCDFRRLVDDATDRGDAEENAVGAAAVVVAADAVAVGRRNAREVVETLARGDAAGGDVAVEVLRVDERVLPRARDPRLRVHLGVHRILDELLHVRDREVLEKLLREHRHRAGRVAEFRVEPAAGEGVLRLIADVPRGVHRKRAEFDDFFARCRRWRRSRKLLCAEDERKKTEGK